MFYQDQRDSKIMVTNSKGFKEFNWAYEKPAEIISYHN